MARAGPHRSHSPRRTKGHDFASSSFIRSITTGVFISLWTGSSVYFLRNSPESMPKRFFIRSTSYGERKMFTSAQHRL